MGNPTHQKLIKREKQGVELFDTELGSVVFGPVDISESEPQMPSPQDLADLFEEGIVILRDHFGLSEDMLNKLSDLITDLRLLPDDLEPANFTMNYLDSDEVLEKNEESEPLIDLEVEEEGVFFEGEEINEEEIFAKSLDEDSEIFSFSDLIGNSERHPLIELLEREADWLAGLWPLLLMITEIHMIQPGAPEIDEENPFGEFSVKRGREPNEEKRGFGSKSGNKDSGINRGGRKKSDNPETPSEKSKDLFDAEFSHEDFIP